METFRRDTLQKLAAAGKLTVASSYSFDDMQGASRDSAKGMPVAVMPKDRQNLQPGICYVRPDEFSSQSGRCYRRDDGVIHLTVHSNSSYDFRVA